MKTEKLKTYIFVLTVLFVLAVLCSCSKQGWRQTQDQNSWENYQSSYKTEMIKQARKKAKARKEATKDSLERVKFFAKLEKIKNR